MEFIKREIESSDYYIVVVAGKYGSLAPDGISFTEKEYDYAIQTRKPVMGFLFHDLGELKGSLLESDASKRQKLDAFRTKIASGKLIKQYKNGEDLRALVFQALARIFEFQPQVGWIRATHARRIDDLERIALIQTQLVALTTENAALREAAQDRRELLAQGEDSISWTVRVGWITIQEGYPPESGFERTDHWWVREGPTTLVDFFFQTTWNELLLTCFQDKNDRVSISDVYLRIKRLISRNALQSGLNEQWRETFRSQYDDLAWPRIKKDAQSLFGPHARISESEISVRHYPALFLGDLVAVRSDVQLQLQALAYIGIVERAGTTTWKLKDPHGVRQLGLLLGKIR